MTRTEIAYRPMIEAELTAYDRSRIEDGQAKADRARFAHANLVEMASKNIAGFESWARWIVATCKAGTEQTIESDLKELAIETWCPLEHYRTRPRRGLKPVDIYRPFFRGYLFVRVVPSPEAYAGVLCASRLSTIMGRDGKPFLMPDRLMNALMHGVKKDHLKQDDNRPLPVHKGDAITIRSGPFADFQATVRKVIGERWKLQAEVNIFGRMTPIEIDIDSVERSS
jgi:transcriptional antiterminator NusG